MKWFIASDIHGSAYYCRKMLETFEEEKADRMLLLGDLLYHGPRNDLPKEYAPKEVIKMLNEKKDNIYAVRGNCDADVDQWVLEFPLLADYMYLVEGRTHVFATHGHIYNEEKLPPLHKGEILLHGHTHVACCVERENYVYMNPGSVSMPKENTHRGYMILEDGVFIWKDFDGNTIKTYRLKENQAKEK